MAELNASLSGPGSDAHLPPAHALGDGQTPLARYTAGLDQVKTAAPEVLRRAFLWREQRKVRRDAAVPARQPLHQVDRHLAGRTVELRFDPFDLSRMDLYLDGAYGPATVTTQNRQRHLAVERLATEALAPVKPSSALDFLAALRAEHQEQQRPRWAASNLPVYCPPTPPRSNAVFQAYYGFARAPFSKTIETDKLFATAGQKELTARLTYLVPRTRLRPGSDREIGSGKSTAVRAFRPVWMPTVTW